MKSRLDRNLILSFSLSSLSILIFDSNLLDRKIFFLLSSINFLSSLSKCCYVKLLNLWNIFHEIHERLNSSLVIHSFHFIVAYKSDLYLCKDLIFEFETIVYTYNTQEKKNCYSLDSQFLLKPAFKLHSRPVHCAGVQASLGNRVRGILTYGAVRHCFESGIVPPSKGGGVKQRVDQVWAGIVRTTR